MPNENLKRAILDLGDKYIIELTKQLLLNNKNATGELIDSLDYRAVETANGMILEILGSYYLKFVDKGLKPGIFPNVSAIQKWTSVRHLTGTTKTGKHLTNEQVGWAVATKIFKAGIKPSNVLRKAKASLFANKKALNDVVDGAKIDINKLIKDALKELKK